MVTPLFGHTSPETAYLVDDYPYGRKVRCRIRYWLEYGGPKKGYRFCSQTEHPVKKIWNNPKKGTYHLLAACMYLEDETGYVKYDTLHELSSANNVLKFLADYPDAYKNNMLPWINAKIRFLEGMISGQVYMTINGEKREEGAADQERNNAELITWRQCLALIGMKS
jgi:hypothetical protein